MGSSGDELQIKGMGLGGIWLRNDHDDDDDAGICSLFWGS
jgi:hypothetical protein